MRGEEGDGMRGERGREGEGMEEKTEGEERRRGGAENG